MIPTISQRLSTSHGELAVEDTGGAGTPLLLIHGNSSCRGVFARQTGSELAGKHRFITFDLPGHGQSGDALDPVRTYSRTGLADCAVELLERLAVHEAVVLGWSLGGHVAIEMLSRFRGMKGLIVTGTPPIRHGGFKEGFVASPATGLPGRRHLSDAEVDEFARMMFGAPVQPFLRRAIRRADGRFREELFASSLAGRGVDQRLAVEESPIPIVVINGEDDPLIRLDYVESLDYGNLWDGRCHRLPGAGHAAFWHAADGFNALFQRFLGDVQHGQTSSTRPSRH